MTVYATTRRTTPSLASFMNDGWIQAVETWTFATDADPTFTFTVSGDQTTKYSAGMRIKLTQTTAKYFIITAVSYSAPNTTVTVYGGTDYNLTNAAVTSPYYSWVKAPQGFPLDPNKWMVESIYSADATTTTQTTWQNTGSYGINIPVGVWDVYYQVLIRLDATASSNEVKVTLSSTSTTESDSSMTAYLLNGSTVLNAAICSRRKTYVLTTAATHYLNVRQSSSSGTITINNSVVPLSIRAVCAYL